MLGDYLEDDNYSKFNGASNGEKIAFARPHPSDENTDIFFELKKHLEVLFHDQTNTILFKQLITDLDALAGKARNLAGTSGGINSDEKFDEAKTYVEELMALLSGSGPHANRLHQLLADEEFFRKAFPGLSANQPDESFLQQILSRFGLVA